MAWCISPSRARSVTVRYDKRTKTVFLQMPNHAFEMWFNPSSALEGIFTRYFNAGDITDIYVISEVQQALGISQIDAARILSAVTLVWLSE